MKIFNLTQYAAIKADKYISSHCGGRYKRKEALNFGGIGIGKLRYIDGIDTINNLETQERFRANLETLKSGLGIYVRSLTYNYLIAIPQRDILSISITKEADIIKEAAFSWTRKLINLGISYPYARVMLLENEIVKTHEINLDIVTTENIMRFVVKRLDPTKTIKYFEEGPFSTLFSSDIKWYKSAPNS